MVRVRTSKSGRAPAHVRQREPAGTAGIAGAGRFRRYLLRIGIVLIVALIGVAAGLQWTRPIPSPTFHRLVADSVRLPGHAPTLPWPTVGSASLMMEGVGSLGDVGSSQPVPIASITKVMTAYLVLQDHPLSASDPGPSIAVNADTLNAYQVGLATQQSVVKVAAGESLTEEQALEGLLIPSGNDLATLLADWDAGTTDAFVAKMNATAQSLGLQSTHFVDVSGFDPGSVSTAADLVRLGQVAMASPAFAQIVGMGEVTLPVAGLIYNFDYDLGHDGIIGIKTGTDSAAGGCFLFEAQQKVDGRTVTLVGAVLGQRTSSPITAVLQAAESLVTAAFGAMTTVHVVPPGQVVARVDSAWGARVTVAATHSPTIVGWPGRILPVQLKVGALPSSITAGSDIGQLDVDIGGRNVPVALQATGRLHGPSPAWRLTRT